MIFLLSAAGLRWAGSTLISARQSRQLRLLLFLLPALGVLAIGISLSLHSTPVWPLLLLWLAILAEEAAWWAILWRGTRQLAPARSNGDQSPPSITETSEEPVDDAGLNGESLPPNVVQQITRVREPGGEESLHGVLRGTFSPGERTQNLHLAFCPPLVSRPEFSFEQVDGPPTTIKAAQVETFGARLEVRLDAAYAEPADVLVEFSAVANVK